MEAPKKAASLYLIDIENIVGCGLLDTEAVKEAHDRIWNRTKPDRHDTFYIAANPLNKEAVYEGWANALYQFRYGPDGADLQIAQFFCNIDKPQKFRHIFLCTGDGGLSPIAEHAKRLGINVTIVARGSHCSKKYLKYPIINIESEIN
jgi:hypothetical protein